LASRPRNEEKTTALFDTEDEILRSEPLTCPVTPIDYSGREPWCPHLKDAVLVPIGRLVGSRLKPSEAREGAKS